MIIPPTTLVKLLSNIPLDNTYTHTLTFTSKQEQAEWFAKHSVQDFNNFSYQRWDPSMGRIARIRVPLNAERLYNVNYIMFNNNTWTTDTNKWFYGFVTRIDYINQNMTEISYEIDVMQTWMFDYTIMDSFVVREHVNDDGLYKNFIEEGLDTGEYLVGDEYVWKDLNPKECLTIVACSFTPSQLTTQTGNIEFVNWCYGIYMGYTGYLYNAVTYYAFWPIGQAPSSVPAGAIEKFIELVTDAALSTGILTIFPYPKALYPSEEQANSGQPSIQTTIHEFKQPELFGGYKPKNNKLYCYPYSFLYCTNTRGTTAEFRYEFFKGRIAFAFCGALSCAPDFYMCPMNYKQFNNPGFNWNEGFGTGPSPYCSWITDTYRAYLAQNQNRLDATKKDIAIGAATSVFSTIANAVTGNASGAINSLVGGLTDTASSVMNYVAEQKDRAKQPPQASTTSGNELSFALGLNNFHFYNMVVTEEYARHIDEYFSMFGYKVLRVKKPNVKGRKNWNYVKTQNINLNANAPVDDVALICKIYDIGITFWHDKDHVGDYSLDNPIVGG